jgi:hypothetical protein
MSPVIKDMQKYPDITILHDYQAIIFRVNYEKDGTQYGTKF